MRLSICERNYASPLDSPMPFQNTMWNGIPTQTTKLHPHIWLDATYVKCRRGSRMASTAVVTAIGCDESGWRQVLGACRKARSSRRRPSSDAPYTWCATAYARSAPGS